MKTDTDFRSRPTAREMYQRGAREEREACALFLERIAADHERMMGRLLVELARLDDHTTAENVRKRTKHTGKMLRESAWSIRHREEIDL